jgi:alpha-D-ribose 1-methylphosphonate 5-triphosphate synthase subunit PhnH
MSPYAVGEAVMSTYAVDEAARSLIMANQRAFRTVMDAMARPGLLYFLAPMDPSTLDDPFLETLILMLCDSNCGFTVAAKRREVIAHDVSLLTYSRSVSAAEANFALISADAPRGEALRLIGELSGGSLLSPEHSATVLFACESLRHEACSAATQGFRLRGPGIEEAHVFFASTDEWLRAREHRGDEFPCGIDFILYDPCGTVVCLPRTTAVEPVRSVMPSVSDSLSAPSGVQTINRHLPRG